MSRRIVRIRPRPIIRAVALIAAAAVPASLLTAGVAAQTLANPTPAGKWSPPERGVKSKRAAGEKQCGSYGAGFVNLPGTDTCVKIGGWVTVEGTAR